MFGGALVGALLVLKVAPAAALGVTTAILLGVVVTTATLSRADRTWHHRPG
jgi:hypothetical protein